MIAEYTLMVKDICETYAEYTKETGYSDIENVLDKSWEHVFDFDFPIYKEEKREELCKKILRHYYMREIGMETVGLWKLVLCRTLNEEMPYFNELYKSAELEFSPFDDTNLTVSGNKDSTNTMRGTDSRNSTNTANGTATVNQTTANTQSGTQRNLFQDTPQGSLQSLEDESYLTDARKITEQKSDDGSVDSSSTNTSKITTEDSGTKTQNDNGNEQYTETRKGKSGGLSYSELLLKYRETILNIDKMVIDSLETCFMQIF